MQAAGRNKGNPSENVQKRTLSARQTQTIAAVLMSKSVEAGLRSIQVAKSTYYGWLGDPTFKAEFDRQEREIAEAAMLSLKNLVRPAVNTLKELLEKGADPVRLRAAVTVLERSESVLTMERVLMHLEKIEEDVHELQKQKKIIYDLADHSRTGGSAGSKG